MPEIQRAALFGKLNPVAYKALESAIIQSKMASSRFAELVHWTVQIAQLQNTDWSRIQAHFDVDQGALARDLTGVLRQLPRGTGSFSDIAPQIAEATERGWVTASLMFGEVAIRTGHLLIGILSTPRLRAEFFEWSEEFRKIDVDQLASHFAEITRESGESALSVPAAAAGAGGAVPGEDTGALATSALGKGEALRRFAVDFTERARSGAIDSVVGRDHEIRQIVDILMRRRQNNPLLVGDAGVGKTAVAEGFALRIVRGDVPPSLREVSLWNLDIGLLQAGASMRGEFEQRLRSVIEDVQHSPKPIILFIDEVHTLVGAGGQEGTGDAANLLKPALARGTLRTIAATTQDEYRKYIEKDPALTRRFQNVRIEEPDEDKAVLMLRGVLEPMRKFHRVAILDAAVRAAVQFSARYIPSRQLPDKAVSLLDTACARVAVSQCDTPAAVEDARRRIAALTIELEILKAESLGGEDHGARLQRIETELNGEKQALQEYEKRWEQERSLVKELLEVRAKLQSAAPGSLPDLAHEGVGEASSTVIALPETARDAKAELPSTTAETDALKSRQSDLELSLRALQGEKPLVFPSVDVSAVASVVADWTGIPVGRMLRDQLRQVLTLADHLERRVVGQRHALESIQRRIESSRARLTNPNRPVGVFMLVGPSGTGKTETALALAESLYGGEHNIITINMSELKQEEAVNSLRGAPPGYVGYGEGGVLTEPVRRRPYSVVLLDEFEKAGKGVHDFFFQIFDKGWTEDSMGRFIDFKNTLILLTSNAAQEVVISRCKDPDTLPTPEGLEKEMRGPLTKVFPDALLNRLVVIPYYPITGPILRQIIQLNLQRLVKRISENHGVECLVQPTLVDWIAERCKELERGARMVEAFITGTILPEVGREFLRRTVEGQPIRHLELTIENEQFQYRVH